MKLVKPSAKEAKEMYIRGIKTYYRSVGNNIVVYDTTYNDLTMIEHFWKYLEVEKNTYDVYKSKLGQIFYYE